MRTRTVLCSLPLLASSSVEGDDAAMLSRMTKLREENSALLSVKSRIQRDEGSLESKSTAELLEALSTSPSPQESSLILAQIAKSSLNSRTGLDDATKKTLRDLRHLLVDTTERIIKEEHASDQKLRDQSAASLHGHCVKGYDEALEDNAASLHLTMLHGEDHNNCRHKAKELYDDWQEKCKDMEDHHDSWNIQCPVPELEHHQGEELNDHIGTWADKISAWVKIFNNKDELCHKARETFFENDKICDETQGNFEAEFCAYRLQSHTDCAEMTKCFEENLADFQVDIDSTIPSMRARQLDWQGVQKMECYLNMLLSDKDADGRQTMYNQCGAYDPPVCPSEKCKNGKTKNSPHYTCWDGNSKYADGTALSAKDKVDLCLDFKEPDEKPKCTLPDKHPCTGPFEAEFYPGWMREGKPALGNGKPDQKKSWEEVSLEDCQACPAIPGRIDAGGKFERIWSSGSYGNLKPSEADFNKKIQQAGTGVLRRFCGWCTGTHKEIYFVRKADKSTWNYYYYLQKTWDDTNFHTDFDLYSTLEDAIADTNAWKFCNSAVKVGHHGVAFPRDCGPTGFVGGQWNSLGNRNYAWELLHGTVGEGPTICPKGVERQITVGPKCYFADENSNMDINKGRTWCRKHGGELASIHSEKENTAVLDMLQGLSAWTGAFRVNSTDASDLGDWTWEDGSEWVPPTWPTDKLNHNGGRTFETRIAVHSDRKWHDWLEGQSPKGVVCQVEPKLHIPGMASQGVPLTPATVVKMINHYDGKAVTWLNQCQPPSNAGNQKWRFMACTDDDVCKGSHGGTGQNHLWTSSPDYHIKTGGVIVWYSVAANRVADCAGGGCSSQPGPPPGGHWGSPYRIYKVNPDDNTIIDDGSVVTTGDKVAFTRMHGWSWPNWLMQNCGSPGSTVAYDANTGKIPGNQPKRYLFTLDAGEEEA